MTKKIVVAVCLSIFLSIFGFDAYLYMDSIPGNSITQVIVSLSKDWPLIPAGIGFFMGGLFMHLFDTSQQAK